MANERAFVELNRASTERMRALAARLTDAELQTRVGAHWTVAIVYAHLAFWDRRVLYVLDRTEQDGKVFVPDIGIFVNDLSLPLWAAIPPREAVRIALENAEVLDKRLEAYPQNLINDLFAYNPRWVERSRHRGEHLDEAEQGLKQAG